MVNELAIAEKKELLSLPPQMQELLAISNQFVKSGIIPKRYAGKPEDIFVALQIGNDLGLSSNIIALKEISTINGTPQISAQLAMALAMSRGVFSTDICWRQEGEKWEDLRIWAMATRKSDGFKCEAEASIRMAIGEDWIRNPKYKSMPVQMLSYRSAMMLIRKFAPHILLGITVDVEAETMPQNAEQSFNDLNENISAS